jgi:glycogen debranching enzyme
MPIAFDRSVCCDLNETISREWLVTNGIGGYAAGTVAGTLTRMQHGLLVAACDEASPRLLLAKIDEEILFDQRTYYLGTNEYRDGTINPAGFVHLETFHLEEGFPVFTYRIGGIDGILLEKRIWMPQGLNTTYIQYRVLRASTPYSPVYRNGTRNSLDRHARTSHGRSYYEHSEGDQRVLTLKLLPFAAYRLCNELQHGNNEWHFQVQPHQAEHISYEGEKQQHGYSGDEIAGCTIRARDGAQPYHFVAVGHAGSETTFIPTGVWYWHFLRRLDQSAGLTATDDLYLPGVFRTTLWPEEDSTFTIIVTAEELTSHTFNTRQLTLSYDNAVEYQRSNVQPQRYFGEGGETVHTLPILPITDPTHPSEADEEYFHLLRQAGGRFLAERTIPCSDVSGNHAPSPFFNDTEIIPLLIPGYFDMRDKVRDMLITLPGLTLANNQYSQAQRLLRGLARHFKQGMLPDRLPTPGHPLKSHDYGSVDTTLWYFYALDHYLRITHDYELLDDLYQRLVESISLYTLGTFNGIRIDPHDGLLEAQEPGKALTWMNASVKHEPVTPRHGKPVEVNALWYNALSLMQEWSRFLYQQGRINHSTTHYEELSNQCKQSFNERFWYSAGGHLYDVIDGPDGNDLRIRPNQLLAFSLRYPILCEERRRSVLDLVTEQLITPYGLRTLSPHDAGYQGHLMKNLEEQQLALHQGSAWPWLLGPFVDALLCVESSAASTESSQDNYAGLERVWQTGLRLLEPFRKQLNEGMLGMLGGVFDGDAPQNRGYLTASALSTGEILRIYNLLAHLGIRYQNHALYI